jgi:hypothetical protein
MPRQNGLRAAVAASGHVHGKILCAKSARWWVIGIRKLKIGALILAPFFVLD